VITPFAKRDTLVRLRSEYDKEPVVEHAHHFFFSIVSVIIILHFELKTPTLTKLPRAEFSNCCKEVEQALAYAIGVTWG